MEKPLIFDIKRYAINDGPGIRITVFFKGCFLNCAWCHNPESISAKKQKLYTASKCIGCASCVAACTLDACKLTPDGIITDPDLCRLCGDCVEACRAGQWDLGENRIPEAIDRQPELANLLDQAGLPSEKLRWHLRPRKTSAGGLATGPARTVRSVE